MMLIIEETPCPAQLSTGLHDQPRRCCQSRNHNWSMLCWSQTGKPFPLQKYIKLFHQCPQTKKRFCCKNKKVISKFMKQRRDLFPAICEVSAIHREKLTSPRFQRFKSNCAPFNWYQQSVTTFDWNRKLKSWFAWCLACQSRREGRCRILGGEISSWMFFLQSLLGKTSNLYQLLWTFIESKSSLSLSFMPHFYGSYFL